MGVERPPFYGYIFITNLTKEVNMHKVRVGNWLFEVKQIKAIRVNEDGDPYNGIATINIVNDEIHIEGLLMKDGVSDKSDIEDIKEFISGLGFDEYHYTRYNKNKQKRKLKKEII